MRYSELIALTWQDIDYKREMISTYRRYNTLIHKFTPNHQSERFRLQGNWWIF
nr:hypothetical protein [Streptococcus hyovaginalis]